MTMTSTEDYVDSPGSSPHSQGHSIAEAHTWPGLAKVSGTVPLGSQAPGQRLTIACKRRPIASARASLRLLGAPEA